MPVEYLTPGVYVEEIDSGMKPIAGVGTSTAAFIGDVAGITEAPPEPAGRPPREPEAGARPNPFVDANFIMPEQPGKVQKDANGNVLREGGRPDGKPLPLRYELAPIGEPRLITSWEQFKNNFGDFQEGNKRLAHAVYGFFNNGGTRAWIARVAHAAPPDAYQAVLDRFRAIDEISLVVVPCASVEIQNMVLDHCENEYLQDRFAIFDGQPIVAPLTTDNIQIVRNSQHGYGAIYYPWIQVYDPVTKGREIVPPSGHIAGIYARVDAERGVHKAPANEVIRGALGVGVRDAGGAETEVLVSKAEQAGLNPDGVNVIRKFQGDIQIWGARTLATRVNSEWRYINVRRLFLFLRKSIDHGTQWVVFEPNDLALWGKITRDVSDFLRRVWRSGALFGATENEAFFVKCDETNNPREVRDAGQVIIDIGVAPVKPAEFVIFRISQWAGPNPS